MGRLTRRVVLGAGATVLFLGAGSRVACHRKSIQISQSYHRLDVLLADMAEPRRIGFTIRSEIGIERLYDYAANNTFIAEAVDLVCAESRLSVLRNGIREDFRKEEIVLCDRFVLSMTECLVAGLRFDADRTA